jgi:hypothetical protein
MKIDQNMCQILKIVLETNDQISSALNPSKYCAMGGMMIGSRRWKYWGSNLHKYHFALSITNSTLPGKIFCKFEEIFIKLYLTKSHKSCK